MLPLPLSRSPTKDSVGESERSETVSFVGLKNSTNCFKGFCVACVPLNSLPLRRCRSGAKEEQDKGEDGCCVMELWRSRHEEETKRERSSNKNLR